MNAMWRREAIPLSYHLLMGRRKPINEFDRLPGTVLDANGMEALPFDRFGDIFCGIIQKKVCDHLGWVVSTGTPYIHHDRASSPFKNLRKEANGIEVNEFLWEKIDAARLPDMTGCTAPAAACYAVIASAISDWGGEHADYWRTLGKAMGRWSDLF